MTTTSTLEVGHKAPDFTLSDQNGNPVSLDSFRGIWVILYFYPKDNTPGCTIEAVNFSAAKQAFKKLNTVILGISPDSVKSHTGFCTKQNLSICLLSDPDRQAIEQYGVWQLKQMYGREYFGVARSTFIINPEGVIRAVWRNVDVKNHVKEVNEKLIELQKK